MSNIDSANKGLCLSRAQARQEGRGSTIWQRVRSGLINSSTKASPALFLPTLPASKPPLVRRGYSCIYGSGSGPSQNDWFVTALVVAAVVPVVTPFRSSTVVAIPIATVEVIITSRLAVTVSIAPVVMPTIPVPTWPVDTVDVRGAVVAAVIAPVGRVAALADAACESEAGHGCCG